MVKETMKTLFALSVILWEIHSAAAVTHSWKAFYTGSTGLDEFPEFVALNVLDDEVMGYFDSKTNVFESKQSWMMENLGQEYVDRQTNILRGYPPSFKANVQIAKQRFNQSTGVHIFQLMYGCDWDDQTGEVSGYHQYGYDGEDFIAFDLKSLTWIAPKPQSLITKYKWDRDTGLNEYWNNYHNQLCPDWVKKYVNYGKRSLLRTVPPSVSLLHKSPSSSISCFATGFYPNRADMFWRKDGEEIHIDVDKGESLPNPDGTFQMRVDLNLSSVRDQDWSRYECVFQLSGMKDDVITKLDRAEIRKKDNSADFPLAPVIGAVVGGLLVLAGCIAGFIIWRKKYNGFTRTNTSDASSSSSSVEVKVPCEDQQKMVKT